jgi:hypothetical protein
MCGGSDTPSNPCFQNSPDTINTLMGSLAYAACGPSPSGLCPTPTGPFTGNGYYSWYTPPCYYHHHPDCAQGGNIANAVYSYGVMSVTGVTPAVGNKLLTQTSPLTPFKISAIFSETITLNLPPAIVVWKDSVTNSSYTWNWLSIQQQGAANCRVLVNGLETEAVSGLVPQINSIGLLPVQHLTALVQQIF